MTIDDNDQNHVDDYSKNQDDEKDIEILSTDDERLKIIGEILSNNTSRTILKLLISYEMTTHDIVQKTGISLSLVLHHINKMLNTKLVEISKISKSSKGQHMKHYTAKHGIMILSPTPSQKAKSSKTFQKSLKNILRFSSIGIAGITSWFMIQSIQAKPVRPTIPPSQIPSEIFLADLFWPTVITLIVIIAGLITERLLTVIKK